MAKSERPVETEIKLALPDARTGRRLLKAAGFTPSSRRAFETNTVFDTPRGDLRAAGQLIRLREWDGHHILTFKGPAIAGRGRAGLHRSRPEWETQLSSPQALVAMLGALGLNPVFRYEKYRTEFTAGGRGGVAMLDETPVGDFLELEGSTYWIDRMARRMGFGDQDYITISYSALHSQFHLQRGTQPADMTFTGARRAKRGRSSSAA